MKSACVGVLSIIKRY